MVYDRSIRFGFVKFRFIVAICTKIVPLLTIPIAGQVTTLD